MTPEITQASRKKEYVATKNTATRPVKAPADLPKRVENMNKEACAIETSHIDRQINCNEMPFVA